MRDSGLTFSGSLRDTAVVTRFHVARAMRTRLAWVTTLVVTVVMGGGAFLFSRVLLAMENAVAGTLGVPTVKWPGTLLDELKQRDELEWLARDLIGQPELADWAMGLPILTVEHFWLGLGTLPFLAMMAGAETVVADARDRSLRFELLRTGRLELVYGRMFAHAVLSGGAMVVACFGTWGVAAFAMVQQPLAAQAGTLLTLTPRLWIYTLPFLGFGTACSMLASGANAARAFAMGGAVLSWIAYGVVQSDYVVDWAPWLQDAVVPALPQGWIAGLWGPGWAWLPSGGVLFAMGLAAPMLAWPLFSRRNL